MSHLSPEFLEKYKKMKPPHGVTGMIVYKRTYSRNKELGGTKEEWWETCAREVNSIIDLGLKLTRDEMESLYDSCFNLKCSFSGRAKWQLGTPTVERIGGASMNNCWGVVVDTWKSFIFTFDMLMLGGGVGFNIQRENVYQIPKVKPGVVITRKDTNDADFIVPDSREGWIELLSRTMQAFFETGKGFSYSTVCVRGKGVPIKGFGGISSGPEDLCIGLQNICNVINNRAGKKIRPIDALDIMDIIAEIVVSGNVRRSALISIGDIDDPQFLNAKRWDLGNIPNWRSNSNNTIVCNDIKLLSNKYWNNFKKDPNTGMAKGEIYGLMNMTLSRKKGRVLDCHRVDPDVYTMNPCVSSGMSLLTSNGHELIDTLVDRKSLLIHDGHGWSDGKVWKTGDKKVITLFGSKGSTVKLTSDHKVFTKNGWKLASECLNETVKTIIGDQVIVDIDDLDETEHPVYDFSVSSNNHQGYVNGFLVHNCGEITLSAVPGTGEGESCNLFTLFLSRMNSKEEFIKNAKLGYKVVKTIASLRYHWENTNKLIKENMRLGISVSGICEWLPKLPREEAANWLDSCYKELEYLDIEYSKDNGFNESIKLTTVQPSGCRPWYSTTVTNQGILTMEDLFVNHPIEKDWHDCTGITIPQEGTTNRVTKTYYNGISDTVRVTLRLGMVLDCTPNHKWFVKSHKVGRKVTEINQWKEAKDLKEGDILLVNTSTYNNEASSPLKSFNSRSIKMRGDHNPITQPSKLNPDLCWFLGYLWGDGAMSPMSYRIRFTDANEYNLEKVRDILKTQFNIDSNIRNKNNTCYYLDVGNKELWHWLIKNDIYKYHSDKIDIIPKVVRMSSKEDIIAFFAGLIDSDGYVSSLNKYSKKITLSTSDKMFSRHVQEVGWSVGLVFGRSLNSLGENFQTRKEMYLMALSQYTTREAIDMLIKHSNKCIRTDLTYSHVPWIRVSETPKDYFLGAVMKVEDGERMETYDIEVENSHWYYNAGIKSHNSLSKLPNTSPGVHPFYAPYYIQRIRFSSDDPLVKKLRDANYHTEYKVEFDGTRNTSTVVVSFPMKSPEGSLMAKDMSAVDQLELVKFMNIYWSDNSTSVTVYYKEEELDSIKEWLMTNYNDYIKSVSFLLHSDHGFKQAPMEEIDEATYNKMCKDLLEIDFSSDTNNKYEAGIDECSAGACPIK